MDATNYRAMAGGASTGEFADFVPFDLAEVNEFIGLLFLNGLWPKPQMEFWFAGAASEPLFGNDKIAEEMKKKNRNQWKAPMETLPPLLLYGESSLLFFIVILDCHACGPRQ